MTRLQDRPVHYRGRRHRRTDRGAGLRFPRLRVQLFERAESLEEVGAGLQLSPNATRILRRSRRACRRSHAAVARRRSCCAKRGSLREAGARAARRSRRAALGRALSRRAPRRSAERPAHSRPEPSRHRICATGAAVRDVALSRRRRRLYDRAWRKNSRHSGIACGRQPTAYGPRCAHWRAGWKEPLHRPTRLAPHARVGQRRGSRPARGLSGRHGQCLPASRLSLDHLSPARRRADQPCGVHADKREMPKQDGRGAWRSRLCARP